MTGLAIGVAFLCGFGFGSAAVVVWIGLGILLRLRGQATVGVVIVVTMTATAGALYARQVVDQPVMAPLAGAFGEEIRVVDGPFITRNGQRFTARANASPDSLLCVYGGSAPRVVSGDLLLAIGGVTLLQDLSEIGRAAVEARGCDAQLRVESLAVLEQGDGIRTVLARARGELSRFLMQSAPGDTGALLNGLVTGDDGALSSDASDAFLGTGTTHITAISGANFAIIVLLLGVLATGSVRRHLAFVLMMSVAIWLYVLVVGSQPSAVRAALLATAVLVGRWLGRVPDLLTLTVLLAALQVIWRPHDYSTLGFQLSLAATIALIVVFDGRERANDHSWLASLGLSVVAAQLATLPVLAWRIGEISGIGLFANLAIGPLAALAFPLAFAGALAGQIVPTLGASALTPAIVLSQAMIDVVSWSNRSFPGTLQLGEPTSGAMAILTVTAWAVIFWMSGDLRRWARHALEVARTW